jgi:hypothetical protein
VARRDGHGFGEVSESAVELLVMAVQAADGAIWIRVGAPEDNAESVLLTPASAERLSREVTSLLTELRGSSDN